MTPILLRPSSPLLIGVLGLGYAGGPLAYALAEQFDVIGLEQEEPRLKELLRGHDRTGSISQAQLLASNVLLTNKIEKLQACDVLIITSPWLDGVASTVETSLALNYCRVAAPFMKKGCVVIFEGTAYPGATLDVGAPCLQEHSGKRHLTDFFVAYAPAPRLGDRDAACESPETRIVAGDTERTLDLVDLIYATIAPTHRAPSIAVAEAAKVVEAAQRNVHVALMNEVSQTLNKLDLDTQDVLAAASTQQSFMRFSPALRGPHTGIPLVGIAGTASKVLMPCVDWRVKDRRIKEEITSFIAKEAIRLLAVTGSLYHSPRVTILGVTVQENVPDSRNSPVSAIVRELKTYGIVPQLVDPLADGLEVTRSLGCSLTAPADCVLADLVLLAVPHKSFTVGGWGTVMGYLHDSQLAIVMDLKGVLPKFEAPEQVTLWRP